MHVKTVIKNEHQKILLLKEKRDDKKIRWDLPGAKFTEDQSFDEIVITNVQKVIGYYVYPGKIIGVSNYIERNQTDVYVIMDASILNGELLLSRDYENYAWIDLERLPDYPLTPWLEEYIENSKYPFEDVEQDFEERRGRNFRRRDSIQHDFKSTFSRERNVEDNTSGDHKSSFGLLKDTIKRTFRPKEAKISQTEPKANEIYEEHVATETNTHEDIIIDHGTTTQDIIIDHDNKEEDIIIDHGTTTQDIIIDHDNKEDDIIIDHKETQDIIVEHESKEPEIVIEEIDQKSEAKLESSASKPKQAGKKVKKAFDMNINKEENMKKVREVKKIIRKEPEIKIIHEGETTPHIRKEKASVEKISFSSERGKRPGWRERLNEINRTDANNQRKRVPKPKGRRR